MKQIFVFYLLLTATISLSAQTIIPLYQGTAPGSENWSYKEISFTNPGNGKTMVRNVVTPTLEVYLPEKKVEGASAIVICPGGGFVWLSYQSEGTEVAQWLAGHGVVAFVLKYRLNHTPEDDKEFDEFIQNYFTRMSDTRNEENSSDSSGSELPVNDLAGKDGIVALQYVKEYAGEFGINPQKVGIMGFSAGAAVTMYSILNSDAESQPNFAAPIYGGWLGDSKVPDKAPPLFVLAAADDPISAGCPALYQAWRDAGKTAELHIYSKGGHGFGMDKNGVPVDTWIERFYDWLKVSGF